MAKICVSFLFLLLQLISCKDDIIISVASNLYNDGYACVSKIENVNLITQQIILSTKNNFPLASPAYSNTQNIFSINPYPESNQITKISFQTDSLTSQKSTLSKNICNSIATSIYSNRNQKTYILSSTTDQNKNASICLRSWNIYEINQANEINFVMNSPFDGSTLQPLHWMTLNEDRQEFIFFYPNKTSQAGGYFVTLNQKDFYANSTNSFAFTFYSIDWLSDDQILGPCVDSLNSFGLCVGNYSSGLVDQIIRLAPSYNPLLTSSYFNRESNLFLFSSQLLPNENLQIQLYVINVTNFELVSSFSYPLESYYKLVGLFIFPSNPDHLSNFNHSDTTSYSDYNNVPYGTVNFSSTIQFDNQTLIIIISCVAVLALLGILIGVCASALYFYLYNKFSTD